MGTWRVGLLAAIIIALMQCLTASAKPLTIRVALAVSADDDLRNLLSSFLTRELRELPNVVVADQEADYRIRVTGLKTRLVGGTQVGYTVAIVITRPQDTQFIRTSLAVLGEKGISLPDEEWDKVSWLFSGNELFLHSSLLTSSTEGLRSNCAQIVADFDAQFLEQQRKDYQMIIEYFERWKKHAKPPGE